VDKANSITKNGARIKQLAPVGKKLVIRVTLK